MSGLAVRHDGPLNGTVVLDGAKHSFAHVLACAALAPSARLRNVPDHLDARALREQLRDIFGHVRWDPATKVLDLEGPLAPRRATVSTYLAGRSRSLFVLLPALLRRAEEVRVEEMPRGCGIGQRPTSWYTRTLREFGVVVSERRNGLVLAWPDPRPARIEFAYPSMTGTSIAIAAAACVDGTSEIVNPTSEPSVADQIMCGRELGADIAVADGVVHVTGGPLSHVEAMVSPDRVLAATYLSAALLAGGTVTVRGNAPLRIPQFTRFLSRLGVEHHDAGDAISVVAPPPPDALPACDLVAGSEPKFSSDWAPFATLVLATRTSGRSRVQDDVFPDRFQFVDTLRPWGLDNVEVLRTARRADVTVHGTGSRRLSGGSVPTLPDIRGGAAIVLSAVLSDTGIDVGDTFQVDRGYTDLARDLRELGMTAAATSGVHA